MEYLIVNNTTKIVENVAEWDGVTQWSPPSNCTALLRSNFPENPHIGWKRVSGTFQPPPPPERPVPIRASKRQIMKKLNATGNLDTVQTAINSLTGIDGKEIQIDWEFADYIDRVGAMAALIQATLGLTDKQIDNIFIAAGDKE